MRVLDDTTTSLVLQFAMYRQEAKELIDQVPEMKHLYENHESSFVLRRDGDIFVSGAGDPNVNGWYNSAQEQCPFRVLFFAAPYFGFERLEDLYDDALLRESVDSDQEPNDDKMIRAMRMNALVSYSGQFWEAITKGRLWFEHAHNDKYVLSCAPVDLETEHTGPEVPIEYNDFTAPGGTRTVNVPIGPLKWNLFKEDCDISEDAAKEFKEEAVSLLPPPLYSHPADTEFPSADGWVVETGEAPAPTLVVFPLEERLSYFGAPGGH